MGNELTAAAKNRMKIFEAMPKELQEKAKQFESMTTQVNRGVIINYWKQGVIVREVLEKPNTFGTGAVEQLAAYFGYKDSNRLYSLRDLADTWNRADLEALVARSGPGGLQLEIGHFFALVKAKDAASRNKLVERVFNESLTVNDLVAEIKGGIEKANKRSSGRKPQKPKSVAAGVQQIYSAFKEDNGRFPLWDETVIAELEEMPATQVNTVLAERAQQGLAEAQTLADHLTAFLPKYQKVVDRIQGIVKKNEEASKAEVKADAKAAAKAKTVIKEPAKPASKPAVPAKKPTKKAAPVAADSAAF